MLKLSIIDCVSSKVSRVLISKGGIKMLKPLHDNVVLKKEEVENKTASGIILTSENKNKPSIGVVEAIGEGCKDAGYQVGDKVVYKEYSGTRVTMEEEEYIVMADEDILAVVA